MGTGVGVGMRTCMAVCSWAWDWEWRLGTRYMVLTLDKLRCDGINKTLTLCSFDVQLARHRVKQLIAERLQFRCKGSMYRALLLCWHPGADVPTTCGRVV